MLSQVRSRLRDGEEGFTLIELMVVVLIIAILIAIAIPTFLGARERAQDRAAQSNLRNGLAASKVYYVDNQEYTAGTTALEAIEPTLTWESAATPSTAGNNTVAVEVGGTNNEVVCLTAQSNGGATFTIADVATGTSAGTYYFGDTPIGACDVAGASAGDPGGF